MSRRERVRDAVSAVIDREAVDPNEAGWMRDRVHRDAGRGRPIDDYRLKGDFRACVETICADLGLEPDWSLWDDEAGFTGPLLPRPKRRGRYENHGDTKSAQGDSRRRRWTCGNRHSE